MGLLIGEIDEAKVSQISAVIMLRRSDKQPDRVEISPEQLSDASTRAEQLAHQLRRPMRVIGWYHSHPHITVWPSHVDVRTQAMYQMMDDQFVGLIFSVFNEDKTTKQSRIQLIAFQSINQSPEGQSPQYIQVEVPINIEPMDSFSKPCLQSLSHLPSILTQEEDEEFEKCASVTTDLISRLYNASVYVKSICNLTEVLTGPLIEMLEDRLQRNNHKIFEMEEEKLRLMKEIERMDAVEPLIQTT